MSPIRDLDLVDMVRLLQKGEVSSEEIVKSCLDAVELYNDKLNAFISIDPLKLLKRAQEIDKLPQTERGLLSGIPVAIKDLIDVSGEVTTAGSSFFKNKPSARTDALIVKKLKEAGAIPFGKTNLHEFAWGGTSANPHYGICYNPWNRNYVAGGSSGGSAISVLMRMAPAALGTDTLGSIRHPSSFCGTVGLKPTYGLLPTEGIFPLAYTLDHVGPMARTVEDVEYVLKAMLDENTRVLVENNYEIGKKVLKERSRRLEGICVGVLAPHVPKDICHEAVWNGYENVLKIIEDEGAEVVEIQFPEFESAYAAGLFLTLAQASQIHRNRMVERPEGFGDDVRVLLEAGYLVSAVDYVQAQKVRAKLIDTAKRIMKKTDCWVIPTTPNPAIAVGETDLTVALFTAPFCTLGFPSIALPSGFTNERLPVSVQIIGAPLDEYRILDIATIVSQSIAFPKTVPENL